MLRTLVLPRSTDRGCITVIEEKISGNRKEDSREQIIKLLNLNDKTHVSNFAKEIIENCSLLTPDKEDEVANVINYLQKQQPSSAKGSPSGSGSRISSAKQSIYDFKTKQNSDASIDKIDEYIESLYDETGAKTATSRQVLTLIQEPQNLQKLLANDTLMPALARVLREDGKKSLELATSLSLLFLNLSHFENLHPLLNSNRIGDTCLRLVEHEEQRYQLWTTELHQKLEKPSSASSATSSALERAKFQSMVYKQEKLVFALFHLLFNLVQSNPSNFVKMLKRNIIARIVSFYSRPTALPQLQFVLCNFLIAIAAFKDVKLLLLPFANGLLQATLAIITAQTGSDNPDFALIDAACGVLYNLCHYKRFRELFLKKNAYGTLTKIVDHFDKFSHKSRKQIYQVFYILSADDWAADALAATNIMVASNADAISAKSFNVDSTAGLAAAVSLSLAKNASCISLCLKADGGACFKALIKHGIETNSIVSLRIVKTAVAAMKNSKNGKFSQIVVDHIPDLVNIIANSKQLELVAEAAALISGLKSSKFDWVDFSQRTSIFKLATSHIENIINGFSQSSVTSLSAGGRLMMGLGPNDDALLELVILLGTIIGSVTPLKLVELESSIISNKVVDILFEVLSLKESDDELVLQCLLPLSRLLSLKSVLEILLNSEKRMSILCDLSGDYNDNIATVSEQCLNVLNESADEEFQEKLLEQKFKCHNKQWLGLVSEDIEAHIAGQQGRSRADSDSFGDYDDDGGYGFDKNASWYLEDNLLTSMNQDESEIDDVEFGDSLPAPLDL